MALVNCKECAKEISEFADSCPHCGFRNQHIQHQHEASSSSLGSFDKFMLWVALLLGCSVSWIYFSPQATENANNPCHAIEKSALGKAIVDNPLLGILPSSSYLEASNGAMARKEVRKDFALRPLGDLGCAVSYHLNKFVD